MVLKSGFLKHFVSGKSAPRREPTLSDLPFGNADWVLRLDEAGRVLASSGRLSTRQPLDVSAGWHFSRLVQQTFDWLGLLPDRWPSTISLLSVRTRSGSVVDCSAFILADGQDWLVVLANLNEMTGQLAQISQKTILLRKTESIASGIRARASAWQRAVEDWLEYLALRLRLAWVAFVVRDEGEWQVAALYQNPGLTASLPVFADRHPDVAIADQPVRCSDSDGRPMQRVPYLEDGRVKAWLYTDIPEDEPVDTALCDAEWSALFALVAGPVLHALHQRQRERTQARHQTLETLLCGGWWEYYPCAELLTFSESLQAQLNLGDMYANGITVEQWLTQVHPSDRDLFLVILLEGLDTRRMVQTVRLQTEGEWRWFRLEGELADTLDGPCLRGVALDVHDVRLREDEAEAAKARLQGVIDSVPGILYMLSCEEGAFTPTFYSACVKTMLGWDMEQFMEGPYISFIHPYDRDIYASFQKELLQRGAARCQYRLKCSDLSYRWVQDEASLLRNERGFPSEVVGLCLDITESRLATSRLAASEERYRILVENAPAVICRYRPDLRLTFANSVLTKALGLDEGTEQPTNLGDFIPEAERKQAMERFSRMTPEQPTVTSEFSTLNKAGETHWWLSTERGLFDSDGNLVEIQAVARDNTEVHIARQQLFRSSKLATLGKMAAGLAHEINQPLNVMHMTLANLLTRLEKSEVSTEYLKEKLERISAQLARTAGIVDHMRVFGRQSDMEGVLFNPSEGVTMALEMIEDIMAREGVEFDVRYEELPDVMGSPDRLSQVVLNLLVNAKFAALERRKNNLRHVPRVILDCAVEGDQVLIRVEDNGSGISANNIERIFEPFFTTKPVGEGSGLGLALSYAMVRQMSGSLSASNGAEGAVFTVSLPIAHDSDQSSRCDPGEADRFEEVDLTPWG